MIRRLAKLGFGFGLLAHFALGQTPGSATGTIQGVVFSAYAGGERSVLPAAKISLDAATHDETQSNNEGGFVSPQFLPVRTRSPRKHLERLQDKACWSLEALRHKSNSK
jgi:hypothetical protein